MAVSGILQHLLISIHALREEGDRDFDIFLRRNIPNFYPRPPRGGRPHQSRVQPPKNHISIHALREEGDGQFYATTDQKSLFLSTPSARRATRTSCRNSLDCRISIHALREEGDPSTV